MLLVTGLIALLVLNTALAKGSIELGELQRESALLSEAAGNLQEEIDSASASGALAEKASQLGLVRSNERAHIDISDRQGLGAAHPASRSLAFPVVTSPTPVAKPKATQQKRPASRRQPPQARRSGHDATSTAVTDDPDRKPTASRRSRHDRPPPRPRPRRRGEP